MKTLNRCTEWDRENNDMMVLQILQWTIVVLSWDDREVLNTPKESAVYTWRVNISQPVMYTGEPVNLLMYFMKIMAFVIYNQEKLWNTGTEYFIMYTWFCTVLRLTQFTQTRRYKINLYKVFLYLMKGFWIH